MKSKIVVFAVTAVVLAGCAAPSGGSASPTVTVTITQPPVTVTATPPAPAPGAAPAALGEAQTSKNGSAVTVFEHRRGVEPRDPNQEAIDVQVCTPATPPSATADAPVVSNQPWALLDAEHRRYTSASSYWTNGGVQPLYPTQEKLEWGDCVRGWIIIQGQPAIAMTKVRYTGSNSILEWKLS